MTGARQQSHWSDLGSAWNAVIEFASAILIYGVAGWYADKWLNTGHVLFVLGLLLGMVLGMYLLAKQSSRGSR